MNGDLSIAPPAAVRSLAPHTSGAPTVRPSSRDAAAATPPTALPPTPASDADQRLAAAHLKSLLTDSGMQVSTHHDEASGRTVLQVRSRATGEVVEQLPAEALLKLYAALRESLVDERA